MTAVVEQANLAGSVGWTSNWEEPEKGAYLWPLQKVRETSGTDLVGVRRSCNEKGICFINPVTKDCMNRDNLTSLDN